jgi:hypothetical protein
LLSHGDTAPGHASKKGPGFSSRATSEVKFCTSAVLASATCTIHVAISIPLLVLTALFLLMLLTTAVATALLTAFAALASALLGATLAASLLAALTALLLLAWLVLFIVLIGHSGALLLLLSPKWTRMTLK